MATLLVTGTSGFIGYHTAVALLARGDTVIGVDIENNYYDVRVKQRRRAELEKNSNFTHYTIDIASYDKLLEIAKKKNPTAIIHLAAQAGVRYSLIDPWSYAQSNYIGTLNVFEVARQLGIKQIVFASTSSVYGNNKTMPFAEHHITDTPLALYPATKKANELLAHAYSQMFGIHAIGLRFFTVYGRMGRPDLALFKFSKNILLDKPIDVYNNGKMSRNFTHVSDIVQGILGALKRNDIAFEVYNLGGENEISLMDFIGLIEKALGKTAKKNMMPMQKGDVPKTQADCSKAAKDLGYSPKISIEAGINDFCEWFIENKKWLLKLEDGKQ